MVYDAIIGQGRSIAILQRARAGGKLAHAYLFDGIEGCGKRKTALALVQSIFCSDDKGEGCGHCPSCNKVAALQHPDLHLIEPDGAFIKIDQVRELQREMAFRPFEAPQKACIIDNADRLNPAAGNALLKTLEEPPGNALIILITANPGGMLPTIISRCQRLQFQAIPQPALEDYLVSQGTPAETAGIASALAGGSLKKALEVSSEAVLQDRQSLLQRILSLSLNDIASLFAAAEELAADKEKAQEMLELITTLLRDMLFLRQGNGDISNRDLLPLLEQGAARFTAASLMTLIEQVAATRRALFRNVNTRLALEVMFMRLAEA